MVLSATANPTMAATYTKVGAKPGDTMIYASSYTPTFTTINKTAFFLYTIVPTGGVWFNITYYLPSNLPYQTQSRFSNITSSDASGFYGMMRIIASNLTTGDPAYPGAPYKINDTSTMTIAGASRTVSHFKMSNFNSSVDYLEIWWDKDTGLMVKMMWWYAVSSFWENNTLISTTAWSASAQGLFNTTSIVVIGGVAVVALVVGVLIGRLGKKKK